MNPWRLQRNGRHVNLTMRKTGGPVHFVFVHDLRALADDLHDIADRIDREQRQGDVA